MIGIIPSLHFDPPRSSHTATATRQHRQREIVTSAVRKSWIRVQTQIRILPGGPADLEPVVLEEELWQPRPLPADPIYLSDDFFLANYNPLEAHNNPPNPPTSNPSIHSLPPMNPPPPFSRALPSPASPPRVCPAMAASSASSPSSATGQPRLTLRPQRRPTPPPPPSRTPLAPRQAGRRNGPPVRASLARSPPRGSPTRVSRLNVGFAGLPAVRTRRPERRPRPSPA
jgi:hypothetical protein